MKKRRTDLPFISKSTGNILMSVSHPFIIGLHKTFQDEQYLYMLYQLCQGGELFSLIQRERNRRHEVAKSSAVSGSGGEYLGGNALHERTGLQLNMCHWVCNSLSFSLSLYLSFSSFRSLCPIPNASTLLCVLYYFRNHVSAQEAGPVSFF